MSLLINNELIWVSIPRCASTTIENDLLSSNLDITKSELLKDNKHFHIRKSHLYDEFGIKETICIKRNWLDRWLSALHYFFDATKYIHNLETIIEWEEITNDFVYKNFDYSFTNKLHNGFIDDKEKWKNWEIIYKKLVRTNNLEYLGHISIFLSENYWKEGENCTYEFDLSNISEFYKFIENKFKKRFEREITKQNKNNPNQSKIIIDDTFKNFVWDRFEKPFIKSKII
jgi:hypothetical protein